jgi:hypothetical protein
MIRRFGGQRSLFEAAVGPPNRRERYAQQARDVGRCQPAL